MYRVCSAAERIRMRTIVSDHRDQRPASVPWTATISQFTPVTNHLFSRSSSVVQIPRMVQTARLGSSNRIIDGLEIWTRCDTKAYIYLRFFGNHLDHFKSIGLSKAGHFLHMAICASGSFGWFETFDKAKLHWRRVSNAETVISGVLFLFVAAGRTPIVLSAKAE